MTLDESGHTGAWLPCHVYLDSGSIRMLMQLKDENMRRMLNLARLIATLIASKAIQITVLKVSHSYPHQLHPLKMRCV